MSPFASRPQPAVPRVRRPAAIRLGTALLALGLALGLAAPASAGPDTLKRSVENLTLWPLDVVTAPVVGAKTIVDNMQTIDDTTAVRIAYPVPGFVWNTFVQTGAGVLRGFSGLFELGPGLVLLPFDNEMNPLFDPVENNPALVDAEAPFYRAKFGVTYTNPGGAQATTF